MYLFILITGLVLFPEAYTLKCYDCLEGTGSCSEKQCSAEFPRCGALEVVTFIGIQLKPLGFLSPHSLCTTGWVFMAYSYFAGGSKFSDFKTKSCMKADQCIQGSVNIGVSRTITTTKCCDSDLCNTQYAPSPPSISNPNGKKCFYCNEQGQCTATLNCEGDEDNCLTLSVRQGSVNVSMKGCATKSMCLANNTENLQGSEKLICCEGDYCNSSSSSTHASFLLLAAMITSLLFLSK